MLLRKPTYMASYLLGSMLASGSPLALRASTTESFSLYAYGPGIGGLPLIYVDGNAYIGHQGPPNATSSANITFTPSSSDSSVWLVNPNTTDGSSANTTWSGQPFFVPTAGAASRNVGFAPNGTANAITSGWTFFSRIAFMQSSSETLESLFFATNTSKAGIYALTWNATTESGAIPVALKNAPPSNE